MISSPMCCRFRVQRARWVSNGKRSGAQAPMAMWSSTSPRLSFELQAPISQWRAFHSTICLVCRFAGPMVLLALIAATPMRLDGSVAITDVVTEDASRFASMLGSPAPDRRVEGIQGLSHLKHWRSEDHIVSVLDDDSPAVRREALLALRRLGTARAIPLIIRHLDEPIWEIRQNAWLALVEMTTQSFSQENPESWSAWWRSSSLDEKQQALLRSIQTVSGSLTNSKNDGTLEATRGVRAAQKIRDQSSTARGRLARSMRSTPICESRYRALLALRHLATASLQSSLLMLLREPQRPPLDPEERALICEALERMGSEVAIPTLARERSDAAAWALALIGGAEAEVALLQFPKTLSVLLALDRLHSTNAAPWIPFLVGQMGLITYRSQPDDVMNDDPQPIQRAAANLIRRSGQASLLIELVLQELEDSMKPAVEHGPRPPCPPDWQRMLTAMRSELKPGFAREDGTTTTQPLNAVSLIADNPSLAKRLLPLIEHPAIVPRVYVAFALARLKAVEAVPRLLQIVREGYPFSDAATLASGKHFEHSQVVRWRGFLCMALGRMGGPEVRLALEQFATDSSAPRDVRYGAVVGLRFIGSFESLPALRRVAEQDVIWMVRDEARNAARQIGLLQFEAPLTRKESFP